MVNIYLKLLLVMTVVIILLQIIGLAFSHLPQ